MTDEGDKYQGRTLHDTFVVDARIGEGGMGVVYAAHNSKTPGIRYAVKFLRPSGGRVADADLQRFRREAQALAALDHPAIVRAVHVDVTPEGDAYIVMEFVRGTSLREHLAAARTPLPLPFVLDVLECIADALDHAHARGVVHRDLKPENVLVLDRGRRVMVKVLDFGVAKILQPDGSPSDNLTRTTEIAGTVAYMSPEQCRDLRSAGPASDRFTLGVMAYELLVGARPFDGNNAPSTISNILLNPLPGATVERADLPPAVNAVLERACAKDPTQRFPTASDFVAALAEALGEAAARESAQTRSAPRLTAPSDSDVVSAPTVRVDPASVEPLEEEPQRGASRDPVRAPVDRIEPALTTGRDRSPSEPARVRGARVPTLAAVAIVGVSAAASAAYVAASHRLPVEHRADAGVAATNGCPGRPREPTPGLFDDEVCIPGGTFLMGSPEGEGDYDEHPRHAVTVAPFYVDRYEVTVARYRRCVAVGACDPAGTGTEGPYDAAGNYDARGTHYRPSSRCTYRDRPSAEDAQPINCISHAQAVRVCLFEGKRLLTEAEWERVARGLGERPRTYPWGDAPPDCNRAAFGYGAGCGLAEPAPVGTARAGATPEGVFDLAGNVAEWTQDWYSDVYYGHAPASNPPGATLGEAREHGGDPQICRDGCRVTRGGAWNTVATRVSLLRGAHRSADAVNRRAVHLGVRCARTP